MRSKGSVDVGAIARAYGGGGHKNAAGCSASGELEALQQTFLNLLLVKATDAATETQRHRKLESKHARHVSELSVAVSVTYSALAYRVSL